MNPIRSGCEHTGNEICINNQGFNASFMGHGTSREKTSRAGELPTVVMSKTAGALRTQLTPLPNMEHGVNFSDSKRGNAHCYDGNALVLTARGRVSRPRHNTTQSGKGRRNGADKC